MNNVLAPMNAAIDSLEEAICEYVGVQIRLDDLEAENQDLVNTIADLTDELEYLQTRLDEAKDD